MSSSKIKVNSNSNMLSDLKVNGVSLNAAKLIVKNKSGTVATETGIYAAEGGLRVIGNHSYVNYSVNRIESTYANATTGDIANLAKDTYEPIYYGDKLKITATAKDGCTLSHIKVGSTELTSGTTYIVGTNAPFASIGNFSIDLAANVNASYIALGSGTGYTITAKRTSSPLQKAAIGDLVDGTSIYAQDVIEITYKSDSSHKLSACKINSAAVSTDIASEFKTTVTVDDAGSSITAQATVVTYGTLTQPVFTKSLANSIQVTNNNTKAVYAYYKASSASSYTKFASSIAAGQTGTIPSLSATTDYTIYFANVDGVWENSGTTNCWTLSAASLTAANITYAISQSTITVTVKNTNRTSLKLAYKLHSDSSWTTCSVATNSNSSATVGGLSPLRTYDFKWVASDFYSESSSVSKVTPELGTLSAPEFITNGTNSVSLKNNNAVTVYAVIYDQMYTSYPIESGKTVAVSNVATNVGATTYFVDALSTSTATSEVDTGRRFLKSTSITTWTRSAAFKPEFVSYPTDANKYTAMTLKNTNKIELTLQYKLTSDSSWATYSNIGAGASLLVTGVVTGLTPNRSYDFRFTDPSSTGTTKYDTSGVLTKSTQNKGQFTAPTFVSSTTSSITVENKNAMYDASIYNGSTLKGTANKNGGQYIITNLNPATTYTIFAVDTATAYTMSTGVPMKTLVAAPEFIATTSSTITVKNPNPVDCFLRVENSTTNLIEIKAGQQGKLTGRTKQTEYKLTLYNATYGTSAALPVTTYGVLTAPSITLGATSTADKTSVTVTNKSGNPALTCKNVTTTIGTLPAYVSSSSPGTLSVTNLSWDTTYIFTFSATNFDPIEVTFTTNKRTLSAPTYIGNADNTSSDKPHQFIVHNPNNTSVSLYYRNTSQKIDATTGEISGSTTWTDWTYFGVVASDSDITYTTSAQWYYYQVKFTHSGQYDSNYTNVAVRYPARPPYATSNRTTSAIMVTDPNTWFGGSSKFSLQYSADKSTIINVTGTHSAGTSVQVASLTAGKGYYFRVLDANTPTQYDISAWSRIYYTKPTAPVVSTTYPPTSTTITIKNNNYFDCPLYYSNGTATGITIPARSEGTLTNLTACTSYTFYFKNTTIDTVTLTSENSSAITTALAAPVYKSRTALGDLTYTNPNTQAVRVYYKLSTDSTWTLLSSTNTAASTDFKITGLSYNRKYDVKLVDPNNVYRDSDKDTHTTDKGLLSLPVKTGDLGTTVTITNNNAVDVTCYLETSRKGTIAAKSGSTAYSLNITGLDYDHDYTIKFTNADYYDASTVIHTDSSPNMAKPSLSNVSRNNFTIYNSNSFGVTCTILNGSTTLATFSLDTKAAISAADKITVSSNTEYTVRFSTDSYYSSKEDTVLTNIAILPTPSTKNMNHDGFQITNSASIPATCVVYILDSSNSETYVTSIDMTAGQTVDFYGRSNDTYNNYRIYCTKDRYDTSVPKDQFRNYGVAPTPTITNKTSVNKVATVRFTNTDIVASYTVKINGSTYTVPSSAAGTNYVEATNLVTATAYNITVSRTNYDDNVISHTTANGVFSSATLTPAATANTTYTSITAKAGVAGTTTIYWSTSSTGTWASIGTVSSATGTQSKSSLGWNTKYYFKFVQSGMDDKILDATTNYRTLDKPTFTAGASATGTNTTITVTNHASNPEVNVYYATSSTATKGFIGTLGAGSTGTLDITAAWSTTYYFEIRATNCTTKDCGSIKTNLRKLQKLTRTSATCNTITVNNPNSFAVNIKHPVTGAVTSMAAGANTITGLTATTVYYSIYCYQTNYANSDNFSLATALMSPLSDSRTDTTYTIGNGNYTGVTAKYKISGTTTESTKTGIAAASSSVPIQNATLTSLTPNRTYVVYFIDPNGVYYQSSSTNCTTDKSTMTYKPQFSAVTATGFTITNPTGNPSGVTVSCDGGTLSKTSLNANDSCNVTGLHPNRTYTVTFTKTDYYDSTDTQLTKLGTLSNPGFSDITTSSFTVTSPVNVTDASMTFKLYLGSTLISTQTRTASQTKSVSFTELACGTTYTVYISSADYNDSHASKKTTNGTIAAPTITFATPTAGVATTTATITNKANCNVTLSFQDDSIVVTEDPDDSDVFHVSNLPVNSTENYTLNKTPSGEPTYNEYVSSLTVPKGNLIAPSVSVNKSGYTSTSGSLTITNSTSNSVSVDVYRSTSNSISGASLVKSGLSNVSGSNTWTNTGLTVNTTYYYWFKATNYNDSAQGNATTKKGTIKNAPAAPSYTDSSITVWNKSGNPTVDVYLGSTLKKSGLAAGDSNSNKFTITGLSRETQYSITFKATGFNDSAALDIETDRTQLNKPTFSSIGTTSFTVTNPSSNPTAVDVYLDGTLVKSALASGSSFPLNSTHGLVPGTNYRVLLRAVHFYDAYDDQKTVNGTIYAPSAVQVTSSLVRIFNNMNNPAVSVVVQDQDGTVYATSSIAAGASSSATINVATAGLDIGTTYEYVLSASGYNDYSGTFTTQKGTLSAPDLTASTPAKYSTTANLAIKNNNSVQVDVYISTSSTKPSTKTTSLDGGKTYNYTANIATTYYVWFSNQHYTDSSNHETMSSSTMDAPVQVSITDSYAVIKNPDNNPQVTVSVNYGGASYSPSATVNGGSNVTITGLSRNSSYIVTFAKTGFISTTLQIDTLKTQLIEPDLSEATVSSFNVYNSELNPEVNISVSPSGTTYSSTLSSDNDIYVTNCAKDTTYTVTFSKTNYESASSTITTRKATIPTAPQLEVQSSGYAVNSGSIKVTNASGNPAVKVYYNTSNTTSGASVATNSLAAGSSTTITGLNVYTTYYIIFSATHYYDRSNSATTAKGNLYSPSFSSVSASGFTITSPSGNPATVTVSKSGGTLSATTLEPNGSCTLSGCSPNQSYAITFSKTGFNNSSALQETSKGTMSAPTISASPVAWYNYTTPGYLVTNNTGLTVSVSVTTSTSQIYAADGSICASLANGGTAWLYIIAGQSSTVTFSNSNYNDSSTTKTAASLSNMGTPSLSAYSDSIIKIVNPANNPGVTVSASAGTLDATSLAAGDTTYLRGLSMNRSYTVYFKSNGYNGTSNSCYTAKGTLAAPVLAQNGAYSLKITNPSGNPSVDISTSGGSLELTSLAAGGSTYVNSLSPWTSYTVTFRSSDYSAKSASMTTDNPTLSNLSISCSTANAAKATLTVTNPNSTAVTCSFYQTNKSTYVGAITVPANGSKTASLDWNYTYYAVGSATNWYSTGWITAATPKGTLSAPAITWGWWEGKTCVYKITNNSAVAVSVSTNAGWIISGYGTAAANGGVSYVAFNRASGGSVTATITFSATNFNSTTNTVSPASIGTLYAPSYVSVGETSATIYNNANNPAVTVSFQDDSVNLSSASLGAGSSSYIVASNMTYGSWYAYSFTAPGYYDYTGDLTTLQHKLSAPDVGANNSSTTPNITIYNPNSGIDGCHYYVTCDGSQVTTGEIDESDEITVTSGIQFGKTYYVYLTCSGYRTSDNSSFTTQTVYSCILKSNTGGTAYATVTHANGATNTYTATSNSSTPIVVLYNDTAINITYSANSGYEYLSGGGSQTLPKNGGGTTWTVKWLATTCTSSRTKITLM